ncbi:MAG: SUMF1/EgtB/PvdO family nonheme iron enzyme [Candidatus Brocadiia bacterium]
MIPKSWKAAGLVLAMLCAAALAADPPYYVKGDTWQETLRASREALLEHEAKLAAKAEAKPEAKTTPPGIELGTWYRIGPFYVEGGKKDFDHSFPPEKEIDLAASYGKLRWRPAPQYEDGVVHNMRAGTHGSTYLYRTIAAKKARALTGYFGSDDGMRAWLNGKLIISHDVPRGPSPNQEKAKLELQEGTNHLLLKIHNNSGGHGFYFHTRPKPVRGARRRDPKQERRERLWDLLRRDFPSQHRHIAWERQDNIWAADWQPGDLAALAQRYVAATRLPSLADEAKALAAKGMESPAELHKVRLVYYRSRQVEAASELVKDFDFKALRLAIEDLAESFPEKYTRGAEFLRRLEALERRTVELAEAGGKGGGDATAKLAALGDELRSLRREALLANPLLDFEKLLIVRRGTKHKKLGLPQNWQGNCAVPRTGYDDAICTLGPVSPEGTLEVLFKPEKDAFVGDVDLHFDADRMLFSMPGSHGRWQIWEVRADGTGLRQVTPGEHPDVDNYDPCYLPNGRIIFASTRCFQGIPCVGGGNTVANLCVMDADGSNIRQLCFDQDHNWCPTVLNNGRVLFSRWEYSDTPHYFTRLLFHMNPDGSEQMEYYGSNSYWPNSIFYARPVPGHPTKVVAVISGHHGVPRMGELVVFDPARGRQEAQGALQRIPGHGEEVDPLIRDGLVNSSWPKFLHPWPLSENYFLVACQPTSRDLWGVYLVDAFDNMLLLEQMPGYALFEPVPLARRPTPPVIPSKVRPSKDDAVVYLNDVYFGRGLEGVPRGTVKKLRLYEYHYAYPRMGGHIHVGIDGPWDVHRILGTVPVFEDGSAIFKVPANMPIAVQPLDEEGKALQVMRSWFTAMPGEVLSCVGCHERQNTTAGLGRPVASTHPPVAIEPWRGPARGFSFVREVQPVLDRHCAGCHDGKPREDGRTLPNFADTSRGWRGFISSYIALHPYVRRPGPESDYHVQVPLEWGANTSELYQMLKKGHQGVRLDAEAWDRLITWIDLNVPCHGTWSEHRKIARDYHQRRLEMRTRYAGRPEDPEKYPGPPPERPEFVQPRPLPQRQPYAGEVPGWPFEKAEAARRVAAAGLAPELSLALAEGVTLELVLVPAGEFVMGAHDGAPDEAPECRVSIDKPFYMGRLEVTNGQYSLFDPDHDSRVISVYNKDQSNPGVPVSGSTQPVLRVSWHEAMAFCQWLGEKTGHKVALPTEAQWEWACRAGTDSPMSYGAADADFGKLANFADQRLNSLCRRDSPKWVPTIDSVNDGATVTQNVGRYEPNAFGLHDLHGNVAEWTRTAYRPYPYRADGRDEPAAEGHKVVRGGSFYDRPKRGRSAFRLPYPPWQKVYNVGFRVVVETDGKKVAAAAER